MTSHCQTKEGKRRRKKIPIDDSHGAEKDEELEDTDNDAGSGYESGLTDEEEMFFYGMDPVLDDPRYMKHEELGISSVQLLEGGASEHKKKHEELDISSMQRLDGEASEHEKNQPLVSCAVPDSASAFPALETPKKSPKKQCKFELSTLVVPRSSPRNVSSMQQSLFSIEKKKYSQKRVKTPVKHSACKKKLMLEYTRSAPNDKTTPTVPSVPSPTPPWKEHLISSSGQENTPVKKETSRGWRSKEEEDMEPLKLKFCPARTPGSLLQITQDFSALQLFQLFFSREVIASLCTNTNKQAEKMKQMGKKYKCEPVGIGEFLQFCGILVFMGIIHSPRIQDYWRVDNVWQIPFIRRVMTRSRFQSISWNLHISDPEEDSKNNSKKGTPDYDKLGKIRPLLESMRVACKSFYHPKRYVSIDERMVPTKAKIGIKTYIKNKPHKWGYKLFVLCDSTNGYTCDFKVYTGKDAVKTGSGLSYDTVMSLMNPLFLGTGYYLYCDNFYTSPKLFLDLFNMKFGACGTMRQNRYPVTFEKDANTTFDRGNLRWIREGPLLFVKWMDAKEVFMCSTIHKAYSGDIVEKRQRRPDGTWGVCQFHVPVPVKEYNKYMGGVDLSDQRIGLYSTKRKSYRWYKTFFFHFLDMAIVNSYLIYKDQCEARSQKAMPHLDFRRKLAQELCDIQLETETKQIKLNHKLERFPGGRTKCRQCKKNAKRMDTSWYCVHCNVPLCGIASRNCFRDWHLQKLSEKELK